eukprot:24509_6
MHSLPAPRIPQLTPTLWSPRQLIISCKSKYQRLQRCVKTSSSLSLKSCAIEGTYDSWDFLCRRCYLSWIKRANGNGLS